MKLNFCGIASSFDIIVSFFYVISIYICSDKTNSNSKFEIMKKKFFCGVAAIAVATVAAWNVYLSTQVNNKMTDVMLANMEALAQGENINEANCSEGESCFAFL
jgi:phosphatidylserine synthase